MIELFVRHCHFSAISQHKQRFPEFTKRRCYENFLRNLDSRVRVTFLLDTYHPMDTTHFVKEQTRYPVIEIKEGKETGSFLRLLDHVMQRELDPETIVYFLEDDYIHRPRWVDILLEGFTLPQADYVTLYDHKDKYFAQAYKNLKTKLYHTASCHWRTTPSTTNTYAMKFKTLKRDLKIHREFSSKGAISKDHEKFCKLHKTGAQLLSPIPGWSTHAEPDFASPCISWENLLKETLNPSL